MRRRRYRPPSDLRAEDETLPLDTQLTILTRQSTFTQSERNVFSAEMHPQDLVREGQRLGFADIRVYDWDTGIGAYSTTIEERPGLSHWLNELLPKGASRVLLVSQEDRLFRDKWEDQHNRFIKQVAQHGGWVICGQRVYNFRREFDREQFRMACKYGKQYIEFHLIRRMLPARHRAAMSGRHVGGPVPWGYIVDYERTNPTFMHYVRYEPHAVLVAEQGFRRFAGMAHPSPTELARLWRLDGLVFPFFGPEVDERRVRWVNAHCTRDEGCGGYPVHPDQVQRMLTDVAYLGWRVWGGEVARDEEGRQPKVCHQPLVDPDLFWWCHDALLPERPAWAPSRPPGRVAVGSGYRPRRARQARADEVLFLAPGRVRCVAHNTRYAAAQPGHGRRTQLLCVAQEGEVLPIGQHCPVAVAETVDAALCAAFAEQLTLDERDVRHLALIAHERAAQEGDVLAEMRRQLDEARRLFERAKRRALQVEDDVMAAEFMAEARGARRTIEELERHAEERREHASPSGGAWHLAERAATIAERIRATFPEWPRAAQERVLTLALAEAVLGRISERVLGLWMRWQGGQESRRELATSHGMRRVWTPEEEDALCRWYGVLPWPALAAMLPSRTPEAIGRYASRLGLTRGDAVDMGKEVPPVVVVAPAAVNAMADYGFPMGGTADGGGLGEGTDELSGRRSGYTPSPRRGPAPSRACR